MSLEKTDTIDFVKVPKTEEDKTIMIISDTGTVTDEDRRTSLLCSKLAYYYHVIESENFEKIYPGADRTKTEIHIYCQTDPNERMLNIEKLVKPTSDWVIYPIKYIVKKAYDLTKPIIK